MKACAPRIQAPPRDEVINTSYFASRTTGGDRTIAESDGSKDFQIACASLRLFQMRSRSSVTGVNEMILSDTMSGEAWIG